MFLVWVGLAAIGSATAAYISVVGFVYIRQRMILYLPRRIACTPAAAGLAGADVLAIDTADGERITGWFMPPTAGRPLFLHFHGNACCLADLAPRLARLAADGWGALAVDYRGFGGCSGRPTEAGLDLDADAAYAAAVAQGIAPHRIVVLGTSLGCAVAVALATRRPLGALVLEASFPSALAMAAHRYPLLPVRMLMRDRFRTDHLIGDVQAPMLFVHASNDRAVPLRYGRALHALARGPKAFVTVADDGQQTLEMPGVLEDVRAWITASLSEAAVAQPPTREAPVRAI